ncbi:hypothetical protein RIA_1220 [Riemerella anatipestifer RA-GD]|nr:hypothetical protein RIA_1220 [Riemerella anatipestifer RA-GD]
MLRELSPLMTILDELATPEVPAVIWTPDTFPERLSKGFTVLTSVSSEPDRACIAFAVFSFPF